MDSLEKTLNYNNNLFANVTKRMKLQLAKFTQEDIDKRLLVLMTIMTDLIDDPKNIMDFLAYTKNGIMTRLYQSKKL